MDILSRIITVKENLTKENDPVVLEALQAILIKLQKEEKSVKQKEQAVKAARLQKEQAVKAAKLQKEQAVKAAKLQKEQAEKAAKRARELPKQQQDVKVAGTKRARNLPPPPAPAPTAASPSLTMDNLLKAQEIIKDNSLPLSKATSKVQKAHAKLVAHPSAQSGRAGYFAALHLCRIATALENGTNGGSKLSNTSPVIVALRCDEWDLNVAAAAAGNKRAAHNNWFMAFYGLGKPRWGESQKNATARWEAREKELIGFLDEASD
jgi:hypothetical protein